MFNKSDLFENSTNLLDFPTIVQEVANFTQFPPAKKLAMETEPSFNFGEVASMQKETEEGIRLLNKVGEINLYSPDAISSAVDRASRGGSLTGLELVAVEASLDVHHRVRCTLPEISSSFPTLSRIAQSIPNLVNLQRKIGSNIGPRGDVLDSANPKLKTLRSQVFHSYNNITSAIKKVMHSPAGRTALQEEVISVRSERLVVPVKTEFRHRISGIVHDASQSGATLFIEPFETVELCNAWRETILEEEREVRQILQDLSSTVGICADKIKLGNSTTAKLDLILARAKYSTRLHGEAVVSTKPLENDTDPLVRISQARHPLLGKDSVPITIHIDRDKPVLLITGPNTGGKTVAMKTIGLLALMHQSGLRIPTHGNGTLPVFDGLYADIGDQQSILGSMSTFGSHIRNLAAILKNATSNSLVLLDELGTSTDPEEGAAIAKAILGHLASRKITTVATTHHRTVASYAETTKGIANASVDLDLNTLKPTYHISLGVPGRSYAMSVAAQLGLPKEIMSQAESLLDPDYQKTENWLKTLREERDLVRHKIRDAEVAEEKAEEAKHKAEAAQEAIVQRRANILRDIQKELEAEYIEAKQQLRRVKSSLAWHASPNQLQNASIAIAKAKEKIHSIGNRIDSTPQVNRKPDIYIGASVLVKGLNAQGKVVNIPHEGDEVEVIVGNIRFRIDRQRLTTMEPASPSFEKETHNRVNYETNPSLSSSELHIRGMRVTEAISSVEKFFDKALMDELRFVRIIHGKGTGVLRDAVHNLLKNHKLVKYFQIEEPEQGGSGITKVELE